ncbi:MAG: hypothetical protein WC003_17450, partial [Terrimicrobiaceae bacterium]
MLGDSARQLQLMQKTLAETNIKIQHVFSDIDGTSAQATITGNFDYFHLYARSEELRHLSVLRRMTCMSGMSLRLSQTLVEAIGMSPRGPCKFRSGSFFQRENHYIFSKAMKFTRPHQRQDWIALQLSKLAAARIRGNPEIIKVGLENIRRWEKKRSGATAARMEWADLIQKYTPQEIADLLESEGDEAQRLRSSMPFIQSPFFTEEERLNVIARAYAD